MAKIMDHILPILSLLECWAIILGFFGGPGLTVAHERARTNRGGGPLFVGDASGRVKGRPSRKSQTPGRIENGRSTLGLCNLQPSGFLIYTIGVVESTIRGSTLWILPGVCEVVSGAQNWI